MHDHRGMHVRYPEVVLAVVPVPEQLDPGDGLLLGRFAREASGHLLAVVLVQDADRGSGQFLGRLLLALEQLTLHGGDQNQEDGEDEKDACQYRGQDYPKDEACPPAREKLVQQTTASVQRAPLRT